MKNAVELEQIAQTDGLIAGAVAIGRGDYRDDDLIEALARGASSRNTLITDDEIEVIRRMEGSAFFDIQIVLCKVIPQLAAAPAEVMKLIATLVEAGGDDLAANQPNAAFRDWCAADDRRADDVIASARGGDTLAMPHLVFALQAKADVYEAFQSAVADGDERTAGVLALSRMTLDRTQSARAVEAILAASENASVEVAAGLVKSALDIVGKATDPDRSKLALALDRLSRSDEPLAVHLMATALYWHGNEMTEAEVASCLRGIQNVDPKNGGTVRQIDDALEKLWPGRPTSVGEVMFKLLSDSRGEIGIKALGRIMSPKMKDDDNQLGRMLTEWLLSGDYHVCSAIASHVSEINRDAPCLQISAAVLPDDPVDQVFVCRKAIGHFYLAPMTAATWAVAVLRAGGDASEDAAELLFNPLLLNYGGALKDWLESQLETEAPGNDKIRSALSRAQVVLDGFDAARTVVELQPSTGQRALVRFQEAEDAERIQEGARENSIFADMFTRQTLLYGDRSSFSIMDDQGKRRPQTVKMAPISVSSELPRGLIFDPVGTEQILEVFRHERKIPK